METEFKALEDWFSGIRGSITAFSGGVDSTLVVVLSKRYLGEGALACISDSPSLKRSDLAFAQSYCAAIGIRLEVVRTQEVDDPNYYSNPANRCFVCKSHLYEDLKALGSRYPAHALLNGTNRDDMGDYRPGLKAASDSGILSPLADCGIGKEKVRALAKELGVPNWDKPASPCLSSRVPYGQSITKEKLRQIEDAESVLERYGFSEARVRHFDGRAMLEVPRPDIGRLKAVFERVEKEILELGFDGCQMDEEGFVSGKLNRALGH